MANRIKVLVSLFGLSGLIFAEEVKSDSLHWNTNPMKRQKLFFATGEHWIPPSLPIEGSCMMSGCCFFSMGWYTVARVFFSAKSDTAAKPEKRPSSKLNFEVGYSPGICWASNTLMAAHPWLDPTTRLYWLNLLEGMVSYRLNHKYSIGIGTGYLWTYLMDRGSNLIFPEESYVHESTEWEIWGIPLTISTKVFRNDNFSYEFQLNYYFIKGLDIEKIYFDDPSAPVIETVIVNCWARGWGGTFKLNYENYLIRRLKFIISSAAKIGRAREYKNDAPENAIWGGPVNFFVTGIYLNFGFRYGF